MPGRWQVCALPEGPRERSLEQLLPGGGVLFAILSLAWLLSSAPCRHSSGKSMKYKWNNCCDSIYDLDALI